MDVATANVRTVPDIMPDASVGLKIEGMTCASCVGRVEKALLRVPGVVTASVDLARETAQVSVQPGVVTFETLERAVKQAGYDA